MRKRNVAKSVSHPHVYEYIDDRMRSAYLYFANPQTKDGPLYTMADADRLQMKLRENMTQAHELSHGSSESPKLEDGAASNCRCPLTSSSSTPGKAGKNNENLGVKHESFNDTQRTSSLSQTPTGKSDNTEPSPGSFSTFLQGFTKLVWQEAISDVTHRVSDNIGASESEMKSLQEIEKSLSGLSVTDTDSVSDRLNSALNKDSGVNGIVGAVSKTVEAANEGEEKVNESENELEGDEDGSEEGDTGEEEEDEEQKTGKEEDAEMCSPTHRKCSGGIRDLYDERLMRDLTKEHFVFTFDAKDLVDEKVRRNFIQRKW